MISSNGTNAACGFGGTARRGGSGGSIWIDSGSISGTGEIKADGGLCQCMSQVTSGGRISIKYDTVMDIPIGNITAYGGGGVGGSGTIYIEHVGVHSANQGDLIVADNGSTSQRAGLVEGEYIFESISLTNYGNLDVLGTNSILTLTSGSAITGDGTAFLDTYGMLNLPNEVTIEDVDVGILGDYSGGENF